MVFKLFTCCLAALLTLVLLWAIGWLWFAASVAMMKPQHQEITTDAIVVLTGGGKRVNAGLDLLAQGKGKKLFISGVNSKVKAEDLIQLWDGDVKKVSCCITLGYAADSTTSNATESQDWIRENNIKSIRLVTANYHMARSLLIFRQAMPDLLIYKHPVQPEDFQPWKEQFWPLTFQEYNKWLATWLHFDLVNKNPSLESKIDKS